MAKLQARYAGKDGRGRPILKGYYGVFYDPNRKPRQKEVPLGSKDESAARAALVGMERMQAHGEYDPWTDPPPMRAKRAATITVEKAFERFMASREATGSAAGVGNYRRQLRPFINSLPPGFMLAHVEARHVDAYVKACEKRGVKPVTVRSYLNRIRIFAAWCVSEGIAPKDFAPVAAPPRAGKRARIEQAPKFFSEAELARVLKQIKVTLAKKGSAAGHVDSLLADAVPFTAGTGLRLGEVCALRWRDVHATKSGRGSFVQVVNSDAHTTKSGRERTVPLVGDALAAIQRRAASYAEAPSPAAFVFPAASGGMLAGAYLSRRFRSFVRDAKLREADHHNFHSLRHTFGTHAVSRGVDVYRLKEIMGHASIEVTQRYARLRPRDLADAMEQAFGREKAASKVRRRGVLKGRKKPSEQGQPATFTDYLRTSENGRARKPFVGQGFA